jgi:hypothetical protein
MDEGVAQVEALSSTKINKNKQTNKQIIYSHSTTNPRLFHFTFPPGSAHY